MRSQSHDRAGLSDRQGQGQARRQDDFRSPGEAQHPSTTTLKDLRSFCNAVQGWANDVWSSWNLLKIVLVHLVPRSLGVPEGRQEVAQEFIPGNWYPPSGQVP